MTPAEQSNSHDSHRAVQSARRLTQKLAKWAEDDGQAEEAETHCDLDAQLAEYDVDEEVAR